MTNMQNFYCNKRFDISFSDLHRLVKLCLPTDYESRETRGMYKREYQPCNIIAIKQKNMIDSPEYNIYCWLGQKGLTVLADSEFAVSICLEVLQEVKQNAEDYKVFSFEKSSKTIEQAIIQSIIDEKTILVYEQVNSSNNTSKYIVKEYNGDEVALDFFYEPNCIRLSGAVTSLLTLTKLIIEKQINLKISI